ncbi:uncharacterized protein si:dkey-262k9.2 isoform X1 [Cyprinodon tularosa]|uniref:uncharacterized protein si:dkey-262k9.2 isoform X1 n=2 Tax=Cyprinodon tularosa TaxID=77115 RepID=UPI0018E23BBE|nr:uncharacterized protein si:dkey-262k9.2 isoform X1 [Cyprinodon tularosa]
MNCFLKVSTPELKRACTLAVSMIATSTATEETTYQWCTEATLNNNTSFESVREHILFKDFAVNHQSYMRAAHLKMMRLLFLCALLLLPAAIVLSEDFEGSADDSDDEDMVQSRNMDFVGGAPPENDNPQESQMTLIIIAVLGTAVALSVIAIGAVFLMKRQKLKQQQGIYSVPTEQNQKETI